MNASTADAAPTPKPAVGHYRLDSGRTTVRFHTRHLFGLGAVSGTVRLREADLTVAEPITSTSLHAVLDAASFETGHTKRDTNVRSAQYLDVTAFPDITFDSREIRQHDRKWMAAGTVTAHGVAAPADLILEELHNDNGELSLRASARIDRYAHQVTAGKGMAARWLTVDITATVRRDHTDD